MKFYITHIFVLFIFLSCNSTIQEKEKNFSIDEMKIPLIETNKKNRHLKLNNGVLSFREKAYSGIVNEFYVDGNIKSKSEYYQGKRQGFFNGWYRNGSEWFQRFYNKGLKSDIHIGWHTNGKQMFEYHFNDKGVYHGSVKDWHSNGILGKHFNFVDGKETGSQKMWNLKGKIRANFYTVNNERHGLIGLKNCVSVLKTEVK